MTIKELQNRLSMFGALHYYSLNANYPGTHILRYNRKWEYFYLDERGGIHNLKTFATEEEACEYAYQDAIATIKTFEDAYKEAVERFEKENAK